ncbi:MAG: hypothetical protein KDE31_20650, partial [Caldilineaceae bacterium]|nr:hypothetical protein [Caldilineaceae bacterium]
SFISRAQGFPVKNDNFREAKSLVFTRFTDGPIYFIGALWCGTGSFSGGQSVPNVLSYQSFSVRSHLWQLY